MYTNLTREPYLAVIDAFEIILIYRPKYNNNQYMQSSYF